MAVPVYKPDWSALGKFMRSGDLTPVLESVGEQAKRHAESISPVKTGRYRDSFRLNVEVATDRLQAVLSNDAPYALVVEHRDRVLGRTVDGVRA